MLIKALESQECEAQLAVANWAFVSMEAVIYVQVVHGDVNSVNAINRKRCEGRKAK